MRGGAIQRAETTGLSNRPGGNLWYDELADTFTFDETAGTRQDMEHKRVSMLSEAGLPEIANLIQNTPKPTWK